MKAGLLQLMGAQLAKSDLVVSVNEYEGISGTDYYSLVPYKILLQVLDYLSSFCNSLEASSAQKESPNPSFKVYVVLKSIYTFNVIRYIDPPTKLEFPVNNLNTLKDSDCIKSRD
eukprot:CAMPEP_0116912566 /NCGR_PEP_ID=MMETSP0467-20121206/16161_1 /TAXON_ID=283647 /ORGANISM="Mesodinium pulex, Strain SPMC105" /LENGTH=114 /DNA_ID=CAMNT_0004588567 /DNA_START=432 /DNA_END=776 /DNA_ORIENTATION=+